MVRIILASLVLIVLVGGMFGAIGCGPQPVEEEIIVEEEAPAPEKAGPPPGEIVRASDFSIAISNIERKEEQTVLYFAVTKTTDGEAEPQVLPVVLIDDHGNEYKGGLVTDFGLKEISSAKRQIEEAAEDITDSDLREEFLRLSELTAEERNELAQKLSKLFSVSAREISQAFEEILADLGAVDTLQLFPKGFTYVDAIAISMPKVAPIEKVIIGEKEKKYNDIKFGEPQYLREFGSAAVTPGQEVKVGEWLSFTTGNIEPALRCWELLVDIENKDYNPLTTTVQAGVQLEDGTISWTSSYSTEVPATSESSEKLSLSIPSWLDEGPPQARTLLLLYCDQKSGMQVLKINTMTTQELPPLVGQGPREIEDKFIDAYQRNGGQETMGDPVSLPHWFAGGNEPKDENDLLIQELSSSESFSKSAIVWNKQADAPQAYVIYGAIWEKYQDLGGPYFVSRVDNNRLGVPTSDTTVIKASDSHFNSEGFYSTFEGGAIASRSGGTAISILGGMFEKWELKELTKGVLGFPMGNAQPASSSGAQGFNTTGWVQDFEGGHLWYHSAAIYGGVAFETHGPVDQKYIALGGASSWLGFPTVDEYISATGHAQAEFEAGYVATADGSTFQAFPYEQGKIAFVSDRGGNEEIYVTDCSGRTQLNLTKNPANDSTPVWSPDGTRIAFVSDRQPSGVYLMNADGTGQRFLAEGKDPSWSSDGSKIAFVRSLKYEKTYSWGSKVTSYYYAIFIMNADGTSQQQVPLNPSTFVKLPFGTTGRQFRYPAISPDGNTIVFAAGQWESGHPYGIYSVNLDGTGLRELAGRSNGTNTSWSPDGLTIAFRGDPGPDYHSGGHLRTLVYGSDVNAVQEFYYQEGNKTQVFGGLDWGPDGQSIIFSGRNRLQIINVGEHIYRELAGKGNNYDPDWNGTTIPAPVPSTSSSTATKADLLEELEELKEAMLKKIDSDIEVTSIAFTDVKDYWRSKRWADILRVPLTIIEDTIGILKNATDWSNIVNEADTILDSSEANWKIASLVMTLHGLQELGGQLQLAIDGPTYTSTLNSMLDEADSAFDSSGDNWESAYRGIIKDYLYHSPLNKWKDLHSPVVIPRNTTTVKRDIAEVVEGADPVRASIRRIFDDLIAEIQSKELPHDFPLDSVITQLHNIKMQVIKSQSWPANDITYETYLLDGGNYVLQDVETSLGAVGSRYTFFGQVASNLNKKLEIEANVETVKALGAVANVILLYTNTYKVEGSADETRVVGKLVVSTELALKGLSKTFYPDAEDAFYMLPQEMVFALPWELSNLWMIADDTDQYIRLLLDSQDSSNYKHNRG